ncbi:hypothetical protein Y032_0179g750 [Ancylostoma ceylanicum]|uniref:Uncharacterized protein n=1 Tax=Ancylostoma ceylanicum TaxID=53326 RepID=A0A016STW3_9BILA|nr:hypothetical protein Y032_0179g750 [Ancylostoma ceylanicum]
MDKPPNHICLVLKSQLHFVHYLVKPLLGLTFQQIVVSRDLKVAHVYLNLEFNPSRTLPLPELHQSGGDGSRFQLKQNGRPQLVS